MTPYDMPANIHIHFAVCKITDENSAGSWAQVHLGGSIKLKFSKLKRN